MNFSEENSNGEKYKGVESLGNFANGGADDTRRYINRGFLPLIGRHMYGLASSSVNNKIIRKYNINILSILIKQYPTNTVFRFLNMNSHLFQYFAVRFGQESVFLRM